MHEITIEDVRRYLASRDMDKPVGIPSNPRACLVEQALEHKYPGKSFHVNSNHVRPLRNDEDEWEPNFPLPLDVQGVVEEFDRLADQPTRAQVEAAIPVLAETRKGDN